MVTYDYSPVDGQDTQDSADQYRPRTVTEQIAGITTAKTYYAYRKDTDGNRIEITERCADPAAGYGDSNNLRTVNTYYPVDSPGKGRIKQSQQPDGRLSTTTYETGTWNGAEFIAGAGHAERITTVEGTVDNPDGIANRTTRQITISDAVGNSVYQETQIYTGSGNVTVQWRQNTYDSQGHLLESISSDGTVTSSTWNCCGKESDTDALGIQTTYNYDDLDRLETAIRQPANGDIITVYSYDAAGRQLSQTITGGALTLSSATGYDTAGRLETSTDTAGRTTTYDYSPDGLTTTVTRPGNITEITTRYIDGRTKSITGTGVTARHYTYGVNADGTQWSQVATGSAMVQRTITDLLGRTIRTEQPGYQGTLVAENHYDSAGRLERTSTTGQADTLYAYDELGNQTASGLDIDANGLLEPASTDRISLTATAYTQIDGAWWQQTTQSVYAADNDATATTAGTQRQRLTGLGSGLVAETVTIDIHGNATVSRTSIDPANQRQTQTIDYPDTDIDAQSVTVGGLLASTTTKTGLTTTYAYDTLGRRTGVTDPRIGAATTHYDDKGQVDWIQNAAGHRTEFAYDDTTGRKISQTDPLGNITRFDYDDQGRTTHTWGDVPYPVHYQYDDYGRMNAMTTYRSDEGFDADTFPASATGDTTIWHYDQASGLLDAKEYADGTQVSYTYTTVGRLYTRTWARQDNSQPLVTTYDYDPDTGELTGIDYSDATADIGFTYDRLGRQHQITDAVGTRTFAYNETLQLASETITGLYEQTLTRAYDTTVPGRPAGVSLTTGYSTGYGYDPTTGRFNTLTWNANSQSDSITYGYLPNSELLETLTHPNSQLTTYAYEPNRNLKTSVRNDYNSSTISQYDYIYDEIGRRTSVANTGSAFAQAAFSAYNYNDRSELTDADRYLGTDIADTSNPVNDQQRGYTYDPIGNRTQSETAGVPTGYSANAVNQYTAVTEQTTYSPTYDLDGNLQNAPDGMHYTYNGENRLIAAQPETPTDGDARIEFTYDYMGRRVQKLVYTYETDHWSPITEHQYIYDGWNLIQETTTPTGQSAVDKYYVWGLDLSQSLQGAGGVGGLVAKIQGSLTTHYCYDANGNVTQLIDAADGSLAAHYEYDPFGNTVAAVGPDAGDNVYRFSTKYYDEEVNLYYYGYRYYSPELGRWINRDPIGQIGSLNIYSYIINSSVNFIDVDGLRILDGRYPSTYLEGFGDGMNAILNTILDMLPSAPSLDLTDYNGYDWQTLLEEFVLEKVKARGSLNGGFAIPIGPSITVYIYVTGEAALFKCYDETKQKRTMFEAEFSLTIDGGVGFAAGVRKFPASKGTNRNKHGYNGKKNKHLEGKNKPIKDQFDHGKEIGTEYKYGNEQEGCPCPNQGWSGVLKVGAFAHAGVVLNGDLRGFGEWTFGTPFGWDNIKPKLEANLTVSAEVSAQIGLFGETEATWNRYLDELLLD
jgi:RHS repeat-associated protein